MEKRKLNILGLSSSQSQMGSYALVLEEVDGNRRLPIIIGPFEAQAIALELEKIRPGRPMTHDLFVTFAISTGVVLKEVLIHRLEEGIFYADIIFESQSGKFSVDSRPSDAIAIAIRFDAQIFTTEDILEEAGIEVSESNIIKERTEEEQEIFEEEENSEEEDFEMDEEFEAETQTKISETRTKILTELEQKLQDAVGNEDYVEAARLRDVIKNLEKNSDDNE